MNTMFRVGLCALAGLLALPVAAQTSSGSTSTTTTVITVPPRTMQSMPVAQTPGSDSTLWSTGIPGPIASSIRIPLPAGSGGGSGGSSSGSGGSTAVTCIASSSPQSQGASCPAGQTVGGTPGGPTNFLQTQTVTTSCPGGSYGTAVVTKSAWLPTASTSCSTPPSATCVAGSTTTKNVTVACSRPGYVGQHIKSCQFTTSCPSGAYGAPVSTQGACTTIQQCTLPSAVTCVAGSTSTQSQFASCPSGQTVSGTPGGATTFTQTRTSTETCPGGSYGTPTYTYGTWLPTATTTCSTPPAPTCVAGSTSTQSQTGTCPAGFMTLSGSLTFAQTRTVTTSCPSGGYGSPSYSYGAWSPASNTSTCPQPLPATNPAICASHGGMPYTVTPVRISSGSYSLANANSIRGTTSARWAAVGSYSATINFNGSTGTITANCTRLNSTAGISATDTCDYSTTGSVGGGTFVISVSAVSPVRGDWVYGTNAPYAASGSVAQTACK